MDELVNVEIGVEEVTVQNKKRRISTSKKLKRILECLNNGIHANMLYYTNSEKTEFEVVLINKKKKNWDKQDISLFIDLDSISPSKTYDEDDPNYPTETRGRFKAGMDRLKGRHVEEINNTKLEKSVIILKYKILTDGVLSEEEPNYPAVGRKVARSRNKNGKRIATTLEGPSPSKMMRSSPPLVLPVDDINNVQNIGPYPLTINNVQNFGANTLSGLNVYFVFSDMADMSSSSSDMADMSSSSSDMADVSSSSSDMADVSSSSSVMPDMSSSVMPDMSSSVMPDMSSSVMPDIDNSIWEILNKVLENANFDEPIQKQRANFDELIQMQNAGMLFFFSDMPDVSSSVMPDMSSSVMPDMSSNVMPDIDINDYLNDEITLFDDDGEKEEILADSADPLLSSTAEQKRDIEFPFSFLESYRNIGDNL